MLAATAAILSLIFIPLLIKFSARFALMDKPGSRKLHAKPVPVVGGIAIAVCTGISFLFSSSSSVLIKEYPVLIVTCLMMLFTGVWDDRKNLSPFYRLGIQLFCAFAIAASGIRLTSFYGLFGIDEIDIIWQYILTILIITGVTNAFNLMDGIDGLAGGLAFINVFILTVISLMVKQYSVFMLLAAMQGAITGFLKYNRHPAKIFMGDGGSMMLGFLMPSVSILLIESAGNDNYSNMGYIISVTCIILLIPVLDSLRVYAGRIQRGDSPFSADKTHLHHLFLAFGFNHARAALIIHCMEIGLIITGLALHSFATVSICLAAVTGIFIFVCQILHLNSGVDKWTKIIHQMEGKINIDVS